MHVPNITFISTIHRENGNCNAEELYKIIKRLSPDVIFLEAVDDTYTEYEKYLFSTFGVNHMKLEIAAIQKYSSDSSFEYVPVLDYVLSDAFHKKISIVSQDRGLQKMIDNFVFLAGKHGFTFLNSVECMNLQKEMRFLESQILSWSDLGEIVKADIDAYENRMISNIYSYCNTNQFRSGIFMCGAAHRESIIYKIEQSKAEEQVELTWTVFQS